METFYFSCPEEEPTPWPSAEETKSAGDKIGKVMGKALRSLMNSFASCQQPNLTWFKECEKSLDKNLPASTANWIDCQPSTKVCCSFLPFFCLQQNSSGLYH
jgi:hypothetical protein